MVVLDPTFHLQKKNVEDNQSERYKEYRRKWTENPKNHIVEKVPIHIDLESTSACNLKCPMCFQSFDVPDYGYMQMDLFKKIIDEAAPKGLCSIKLQWRGEPLLHPKIVEMVKYAKDKGVIEVMFNTNAVLLNEEMARNLINAGLDKIICSVDGHKKEVYEKIRRGASFDEVLANIKGLQAIKKELGVKHPIVRVQMVDTPMNHPYVEDYIEFWGAIADHVAVEDMNNWSRKPGSPPLVSEEFDCAQPYQRLMISWKGEVMPCCGDHYKRYVVGDANTQSIEDIWKGYKITKLRELNATGESHKIIACAECGLRGSAIKNMGLK